MPTLVILLIFALAAFLFYRIKALRTKAPYKKRWVLSKANIAMGAFLVIFGINRLFMWPDMTVKIICTVFLLYGAFIIYSSIRAYRYYFPLAAKEAEDLYHESVSSGQ